MILKPSFHIFEKIIVKTLLLQLEIRCQMRCYRIAESLFYCVKELEFADQIVVLCVKELANCRNRDLWIRALAIRINPFCDALMIGQRRQSSEEAGHLLRCLSRFVILQLDGVLCSKLPLTYLPNACHFLSKANERGLNT